MSLRNYSVYSKRYEEALAPGVIKARAESFGSCAADLSSMGVEEACQKLETGLKEVLLISVQLEAAIRSEIERAHAHSKLVYTNLHSALEAAYSGVVPTDGTMPTFFTGLAGVGKSRLRLAIQRVLAGKGTIALDAAHPSVPLVDYIDCVIGKKASVAAVLRSLASPEVADSKVRIGAEELGRECARWLRVCGICLVGGDESQFMAQSETASTLITRTLLALTELQVPWFVIANYSLGWKLRSRPSEATQRLLSRPVVLLPDPPSSQDWIELLTAYQTVLAQVFDFRLEDHKIELWNYCAGLKRLLVNLLVLSYWIARRAGSTKVSWDHVRQAFGSVRYAAARDDVNLLIAHAGQKTGLRKDLLCPFEGPEIQANAEVFEDQLRAVRTATVARKTVQSSMNRQEGDAIASIEKAAKPKLAPTAQVIKLPKKPRMPRTLNDMLDAGADFMASLDKRPKKKDQDGQV
jgi:hypothetical protein